MTLNLGLRYERLYGAANEDLDPSVFPVEIPYIDVSKRGDTNNWGPRVGLAWDVFGNGETVFRTGYGLYYGHVRILGNLNEFRNYTRFSVNITNPSYPYLYGGRDPTDFIVSAPANITVRGERLCPALLEPVQRGHVAPLAGDLALHVDAVYTDTNHDRKILDINARDPITRVRPNTTFGRVDPNQSTGSLDYKAVYVKLEKRYSRRTQALVSYTYTRSDDNNLLGRYLDPFDLGRTGGPHLASVATRSLPAVRCCCRVRSRSVPSGPGGRNCRGRRRPAATSTATGSTRTWCPARHATPAAGRWTWRR